MIKAKNKKEVKNMIKKIAAFAGAILIAASSVSCSVKNNKSLQAFQSFSQLQKTSDIPKGRYLETETETSMNIEMGCEMVMVGGNPAVPDVINSYLFLQKKDKSFDFENFPSLYAVFSSPAISSVSVSQRNGYFFKYYDHYASASDSEFMYVYFSPQGEYTRISTEGKNVVHAEFSEDERLFLLSDDSEIYEADLSDGSLKSVLKTENETYSFDVMKKYIITYNNNLSVYDYINHQKISIPDGLTGTMGQIYDICEGEDDSVYILTSSGLYRYVIGGNQAEKIIEGVSCHISDPMNTPVSVLSCSDGSFLINYMDGTLLRYIYDPDADNSYTSVLKIMAFSYDYITYSSIKEFQVQNPNIKIEVTNPDYSAFENSDMIFENYISEFMNSENAPDIIIFSGADKNLTEKLADKGLLYDLSESESIWNPDNNIIKKTSEFSENGKLYNITLNYYIPFIAANTTTGDRIKGLEEFADYLEAQYDNGPYTLDDLLYGTPFSYESTLFLDGLLLSDVSKIIEGKSADKDTLEQYFYNCKRISDIIRINSRSEYVSLVSVIGRKNYEDKAFSDLLTVQDGYLYFVRDVAMLSRFSEKYPMIATYLYPGLSTEFGSDDDIFIIPYNSAVISSRSENKEEAVMFLKTALSEKIQKNNDKFGMPVNAKAFKEMFNDTKNDDYYYKIDTDGLPLASDVKANEFINKLENNAIVFDNQNAFLIIYEAGHKCLIGELTPEKAAEEVIAKLSAAD